MIAKRISAYLFLILLTIAVLPQSWLHEHEHCESCHTEHVPELSEDCPVCDQFNTEHAGSAILELPMAVSIATELAPKPLGGAPTDPAFFLPSRGPPTI